MCSQRYKKRMAYAFKCSNGKLLVFDDCIKKGVEILLMQVRKTSVLLLSYVYGLRHATFIII